MSESGTTSQVLLVKEGNVQSEQTFTIQISTLSSPTNLPAIRVVDEPAHKAEGDFAFTDSIGSHLLVLEFPPSLEMLCINLTIFNDDVAEGTEELILHSSSSGFPGYNFPTYTDTAIIIKDDDSKFTVYIYIQC